MIPVMLAHTLHDESLWTKNGWVAETKVDGHRVEVEPNSGVNHVWSRLGNDGADSHPWLRDLRLPGLTIPDGELCVPGGSSNQKKEDVDSEVLVVFDLLWYEGQDIMGWPYEMRREKVVELTNRLGHPRVIPVVQCCQGLKAFYERIVESGGEGVMLKEVNAPYVPCPGSRRSWFWQKKKKWLTVEVVIVGCDGKPTVWTVKPGHVGTDGVLYPQGKASETAQKGYVNLEYGYWTPHGLVKVGTLGVTGPREELKQYVGCVCEAECAGVYSGTGALRHPGLKRWRDDKRVEDCTLESLIEAAGKQLIRTKGGRRGARACEDD